MIYLIPAVYMAAAAYLVHLLWAEGRSRARAILFGLTCVWLLDALHGGFLFAGPDVMARLPFTSFGEAARFAYGDVDQKASFTTIAAVGIIRTLGLMTLIYAAYFLWCVRGTLKSLIEIVDFRRALVAFTIFAALTCVSIASGQAIITLLAALAWGAGVYVWPHKKSS